MDMEETTNKLSDQSSNILSKESEARLEALLTSIGEGLIATDERGIITRVNRVALLTLGLKKSDVLGKRYREVMVDVYEDGSRVPNVNLPITRAFLSGNTVNDHLFCLRSDQTIFPISVCVSPIMLHGKPVGAIQLFRDISDDVITDNIKADFMSIASHQLRTPLSAINTYAHLINDGYGGPLTADSKIFLDVILSAAYRMNELIDTLLNITRVESGSLMVDPAPVNLKNLVKHIVEEIKHSAEEKNIDLKIKFGRRIPIVNTDSLLVQEVLANLLSNAIKYTGDGGSVLVTLTSRSTDVLFKVKDNGYGVPADSQKYIFKKFFRASNITSKEPNGTGLGLYLISMIAEALDGEVWFQSKVNQGSTFYFSLPHKGSNKKDGKFKLQRVGK